MNNLYLNNLSIINLYKKPSTKSEIITQMIFGQGFDQVLGNAKNTNTMHITTRPYGKHVKDHKQKSTNLFKMICKSLQSPFEKPKKYHITF